MRIVILVSFLFCFLVLKSQDLSTIKFDVNYLASDKLEGRETGTKGEILAAEYVKKRFEEVKLLPKGTRGYYQKFSVKPRYNPHAKVQADTSKAIEGRNVIGFIDNYKPTTIVIGAHFDHLGYGAEGSLSTESRAIHNGADDNASGVALLLQFAEYLKNNNTSNNYLFIAFSGEEKGLWGSNWFVDNPTIELSSINYMINMDMVGRLDAEKTIAIYGVGTSSKWKSIIDDVSQKNKIKAVIKESGVGPSDHTSFYLEDVPVLHFFTGQHEDYHKPTDDVEKINFEGMATVFNVIGDIISEADDDGKLDFIKTKDEENKKSSHYKVTLGVIPDYMFEGKGMKIDGVKEGRPAVKGGIIKDDIVVKMGNVVIDSMMDYVKSLSTFEKGQTIDVTIRRNKGLLLKTVTF